MLEPQAQIVWQHVHFDNGNDGLGEVSLGTTDGVSGRIGARGRWTVETADGKTWQPYLRANYWQDRGGKATTLYSGTGHGALAGGGEASRVRRRAQHEGE